MVLTGEDIKPITHRVKDTALRCLEQTYDIYLCSRCNEKSSKLICTSLYKLCACHDILSDTFLLLYSINVLICSKVVSSGFSISTVN